MRKLFSLLMLVCLVAVSGTTALADSYLDGLKQDQDVHGFRVANVYLNGSGNSMGARFISNDYGFIIDVMRIQSVPQAFFWVKTPITDSKGEPHACEHLLLGKGNRGRYVAALEDMALGSSTAYTQQYRTCYHFNTIAGKETFYEIFEAKLDALLNPDFTDEEIRREVCHIGVTADQETGKLGLEEKGTVYTEMVSSFEKPWYYIYGSMNDMVYGKNHPLSLVSGGDPDVMRTMTAQDLRKFHDAAYKLSNMGVIVSIPGDIKIDNFLNRMNTILSDCQKSKSHSDLVGISAYDFPPSNGAPVGTQEMVTFPSDNPQDPGSMLIAWPDDVKLNYLGRFMLQTFLSAFAGGQTSDLYNLFINSESRKLDIGATSVWGDADTDLGVSVWFGLTGVNNDKVTPQMLDSVKNMIVNAVAKVHDYADGSDELKEFNRRALSQLVAQKKQLEENLNSPPMFGFRRGPSGAWLELLKGLEDTPGFKKSLAMNDRFAYADSLLRSDKNIWREQIDQWKLLSEEPYTLGATPSSDMLAKNAEAKKERIEGYVEGFEKKYGVDDPQAAMADYKKDFDAKTAELDSIASKQTLPGFIDSPPMTMDDQLDYETITLKGNVPMVASTFENMTSSKVGLALNMDVVPESLLVYAPFLPSVMTDIGVVKDGEVVPYDKMEERLQNEVLGLSAYYTQGYSSDRVELVLAGEGSNLDELNNALGWMDASLYTPYLSTDNLPRMRDVIDQNLNYYRNRTKGSEEDWVGIPARAYRKQDNPLFLVTDCFYTQAQLLQRLRWMLTDAGPEDQQQALKSFLATLKTSGQGKTRDELEAMLASYEDPEQAQGMVSKDLNESSREIAGEIARALKVTLADIPDANLTSDFGYLCDQTASDLLTSPSAAINGINAMLGLLRKDDNARMFMVSNSHDREATKGHIEQLLAKLDDSKPSMPQQYATNDRIVDRLRDRAGDISKPTYVGLDFEGSRNGVLLYSAKVAGEYDTSEDAVLNCLSGKLYGGGGPHGLFMKTWAAGLAYSNGFGYGEQTGRVSYYAERCPDVSETMRFVVNQLKTAEDDPSLVDYAVAQVFQRTRASSKYQARGEAMAEDLVDGFTPEKVRAFREKVLEVRKEKGLYDKLKSRMEQAYGPVLIGYGAPLAQSKDATLFMIGPKQQFQSLENYVAETEGEQPVYELYPRDFWLVD